MGRLRDLAVDQQVALLFVVLFGLLVLVTAAALLWSVRHEDHPAAPRIKRDLRARFIDVFQPS